jgi:CheY-like chemotaxis protein
MATILLVEDHPMNRDMLSRRLVRSGFTVLCATDGREGVEMACQCMPDLILMDMSLPEIDGWEATRRLKRIRETARIPIIALTAHAMQGERARAIEAGCDDFGTKPVDYPDLLGMISKHLGTPSGEFAAYTPSPDGTKGGEHV